MVRRLLPFALLACLSSLAACERDNEEPTDAATPRDVPVDRGPSDTGPGTDVPATEDVVDATTPTDAPVDAADDVATDATDGAADVADAGDASADVVTPSDVNCIADSGCYACAPTTSAQFQTRCATGACNRFDNRTRLPLLLPDGGVSPLP